jgi:DNA-binding IclR family transcriptional regulator
VLEATPLVQAASTASVARTAGLSVTATSRALETLLTSGAVERRGDAWRLASAMPSAELAPP